MNIPMIGLIGAESTGKSTLALMLAGRLRTHGIRAELCAEPGSARPFPPQLLDSRPEAHVYAVTHKMMVEAHTRLRPNVEMVVSDRTPFDFAAYFAVRFPDSPMVRPLVDASLEWMRNYMAIYILRTPGSAYVEDGFRAPLATNDYRERVDAYMVRMQLEIRKRVGIVEEVQGTPRERAEFVYHHVLANMLGKTRAIRAYAQIREWFTQRGYRIVEVRPAGSNSVTRFHKPSDNDDLDAMVLVDGGADYAVQVRADYMAHKEHLESVVMADLDLCIVPRGLEGYEV